MRLYGPNHSGTTWKGAQQSVTKAWPRRQRCSGDGKTVPAISRDIQTKERALRHQRLTTDLPTMTVELEEVRAEMAMCTPPKRWCSSTDTVASAHRRRGPCQTEASTKKGRSGRLCGYKQLENHEHDRPYLQTLMR
jgi:hypothetical protein